MHEMFFLNAWIQLQAGSQIVHPVCYACARSGAWTCVHGEGGMGLVVEHVYTRQVHGRSARRVAVAVDVAVATCRSSVGCATAGLQVHEARRMCTDCLHGKAERSEIDRRYTHTRQLRRRFCGPTLWRLRTRVRRQGEHQVQEVRDIVALVLS